MEASGKLVRYIGIENNGIKHAFNKKHNLEPDDLLYAAEIINYSGKIILSDKQHNQCDVLSFIKDINGIIELLAEIHESKDYLLIFNAWRRNKARRRPDAVKRPPGAHVQDATQPAIK